MSFTMIVTKILEVIPRKSSAVIVKSSADIDNFWGVLQIGIQSHGYREPDVFKHWTITTL